jgi:Cu/Ag efflux pump CusA
MRVIYLATTEVRAAVVTSIATTIVSFLPVFAMQAQEGKLFHPLAFTKTFALIAAFILGIVVLPTLVHLLFNKGRVENHKGDFVLAGRFYGFPRNRKRVHALAERRFISAHAHCNASCGY